MKDAFDAHKKRQAGVLVALSALRSHCHDVGATTLAGQVSDQLIEKLKSDRFNLVVVGEFNHGKTSFVNALLGTNALPVGVTPTTATIHCVRYGEKPEATLVRADGAKEEVAFESLAEFGVAGNSGAEGSDSSEEDPQAIKRIDVAFPASFLKERLVLVDTPGVNDLSLQRADVTYNYIPRADAVLFVIDAGQPLKESERVFLQEKLIAQSRDKIVFVVTKADIWNEAEREEALDYIRSELGKLVAEPVVFAVSAERALAGDPAAGGMQALLAHLGEFLAEERGRIVLDNAIGRATGIVASLRHGIAAKRRAASMSAGELERRIESIQADLEGQTRSIDERRRAIREEVGAVRAWVKRDSSRFCDDVLRQLEEVLAGTSADEIRLYLAGFLEDTFSRWAKAEAEEVARALEALAEQTVTLMRDDARDAAKRLSQGLGDHVAQPDLRIDTFGYDVGIAALFSIGIGTLFSNLALGALMTAAAPALAYYMRGQVEQRTRAKALEQARHALDAAATKVTTQLEELIDAFSERLDEWVATVGAEVHRELLDVLTLAKEERAVESLPLEDIAARCDQLSDGLDELDGGLERLRKALWNQGPGVPEEAMTPQQPMTPQQS